MLVDTRLASIDLLTLAIVDGASARLMGTGEARGPAPVLAIRPSVVIEQPDLRADR